MVFAKHCFYCDSNASVLNQWYYNHDQEHNRLCKPCYLHLFSNYNRYDGHRSVFWHRYRTGPNIPMRSEYAGMDEYNIARNQLFDIVGRICVKCSITDIRVLMFDHIAGGGNTEQKKFRNNYHMYRYYVRHPEEALNKLQILCANCNRIKAVENREFPNRSVRNESTRNCIVQCM